MKLDYEFGQLLLFLITQLVPARGRVVIIIIHYRGSSGSSANLNCPNLRSSNVRKNLRMVIVSKWHSKIFQGSKLSQHPHEEQLRSGTIFYITGIL